MSIAFFILGLVIGSFLNVLIDRLPRGENILWARSHCDYCHKTLRWWELVPLFSFIFLRASCSRCHKQLSFQYPLIELVSGVGLAFLASSIGTSDPIRFSLLAVIAGTLLVIAVSDGKYQIIPDEMVVVGMVSALGYRLLYSGEIIPSVITAIVSAAFFYFLWRVTRGVGMGLGDVKLALYLGLWLGYPVVIVAFYIAFLTGAFVGVILMITGKKKLKSHIAFGPFLIFGTLASILWQDQIMQMVIRYLRFSL